MKVAGIVSEYNPFHNGHCRQLEATRAQLGGETAILCVMSGNFVQRGEFAILNKHSRAEAAVKSGADLVLELPLPYALSSAEGFGRGAVEILNATGIVTHLSFGSEAGELEGLERVARCLLSDGFPPALKTELACGMSFGTARQRAAERVMGDDAKLLREPNNILAIEYLKALIQTGSGIEPMTVKRIGVGHDGPDALEGVHSASGLRRLILGGESDRVREFAPEHMWNILNREMAAGRAPVTSGRCARAILSRLRTMSEAEFEAIPDAGEGLYHRLENAARKEVSLEDIVDATKTKRYAHARIRRMILCAYLGVNRQSRPRTPPYLRVLAFNEQGQSLLRQMAPCAAIPIITKPAQAKRYSEEVRQLFELEARSTDLYALAYPDLNNSRGGTEWRTGAVLLSSCDRKGERLNAADL